ncbi:MAG TPA: glutathione peroxidase [Vicinamibacterales bacterium]|jgi:glutathione peroxidase|nr:glutathione peroxidase [Vicinamibacterales bacterium]
MANVYDFEVATLRGMNQPLADYRGKTLLIVNVASACGYTPQYAGLEALYRKYQDRGFVVLGFPCNQFGAQEPGSADDIATFCSSRYDVTFPLFAKIDVNGAHAHPLFEHLKQERPGALGTKGIKWNFTKFLVDGLGEVVERYGSSTTPEQIDKDVAALLASAPPS